ncbi:unnamed protein product [Alternaria alternata]
MLDMSENSTPRRASVDTVKATRPISKRAERRKEASEIDDLVSDFGLLAVNATARDFYGFTTEMSYARLIRSASAKEPLPTGLIKALPPKYAATPLIQHYLNNIFTLWPVFEEATLYSSVEAVYSQGDNAKPWDRWSVRMVLAIACLSQSESRGDTHYSDAVGHMNAALENAEDVLHPGYVSSIQALILWTIYATMDPHHFDSWTLVGAASRAMVDLGIHQDPSKTVAMSRPKLEIRRRVYWCVYSLDRSTSLVQTRAFSFSDEAANVGFPFHNASISPKFASPTSQVFQQSFDTAVDLFRIREIQSEWYMDLFQSGREPWQEPYQYIWKQYSKMSEWFQDMPQSTLPAVKSFFELELLYSYVYILSPSPRIPHIHEYAQRLIFEHCIAYATNLLAILDKPSNTVKPPVTFYDAMRAYMTGRQFVDVLSRNMEMILDPRPPVPPTPLAPQTESEDPLAPPAQVSAPPFPSPLLPEGQMLPLDPTTRAINAIHDFTSVLSKFGLRFGFTHWRDRFQRESAALSAQLYQRQQASPHTSPPVQQIPPPVTYPPQWVPMPSVSPQAPQLMYPGGPTTPPSLFPQSSPFASSMSYNGTSYDGSGHSPQPHGMTFDASPGQQTWTTPSPQPLPELPQPSGGQKRRAMVYGPGLPAPQSGQGHSPGASSISGQDSNGWPQQEQQQQDTNGYFQAPPSMPHQHSNSWTQDPSQGNWG